MKDDGVIYTLVNDARKYAVPGVVGFSILAGASHPPAKCETKALCDWTLATLSRHPDDMHSTVSGVALPQGWGHFATLTAVTTSATTSSGGFR